MALIHTVETRRSEEGDDIVRLSVIAMDVAGCNGSAANCRNLAANGDRGAPLAAQANRWLQSV
jgi:hypothetical protein